MYVHIWDFSIENENNFLFNVHTYGHTYTTAEAEAYRMGARESRKDAALDFVSLGSHETKQNIVLLSKVKI